MTKGRIIIADIEKISCNEERILSQIAQRYVEKYQKHKRETDKKQELIAGYLLKEYLGVENDARLVISKNGKPMLVDARKHFNLSHSGKYVVLAIADQEVGIDIERVRPYHEATAKKIFSNEIQNAMSELCGEEKDRIFTQLWTELEAKLKVKGIGFSKEWENEKVKEYFIETRCIDEYYVSLATEEKISVEIEWFTGNGKEVKSMIKPIMRDIFFLNQKSELATEADKQIAIDLLDTLKANEAGCVGMAANMIGVKKRIIAVNMGLFNIAMFNPKIVKRTGAYETEEGCLSLDGVRSCRRYQEIEVEYQDMNFKKKREKYSGWTAQIIQHEIDHCDGILI